VLAAIALAWHDSGAHRIDRDADGEYEDSEAIRIMDAWWPRLVEAQFRPTLGGDLYDRVAGRLADDHNRTDHLGSAFQGSAYGYVQKDLRELLGEPVRGSYSRVYCGRGKLGKCRAALLDSLREALQHSSPASWAPTATPRAPRRAPTRWTTARSAGSPNQDALDQPADVPAGGPHQVAIRTSDVRKFGVLPGVVAKASINLVGGCPGSKRSR
jgi:hypothetical protein